MMCSKWTLRAIGTPGGMVADIEELRRGLRIIADPANGCEIVALTSGRYACLPGNDIAGLIASVDGMPAGIGVYVRANPVPVGLGRQSKNGDVVKRRWLYIDVDPTKPEESKDDPATSEEKERCSRVAERLLNRLSGAGWPAPIVTDSGNGYALLYRIDLPNDLHWKAVLGRLMKTLSDEFSGEEGTVDRHVHNANRLVKLPGTWAKKGKESETRFYRKCWIVSQPAELLVVAPELIEAVAGVGSDRPAVVAVPSTNGTRVPESGFVLKAGQTGTKGAYGKAALDRECARVSLSRPPAQGGEGRNNALNAAAFSLAQLVAGGELDRNEVESRLTLAAMAAGLEGAEIASTIRSGMAAGIQKPRTVPPLPTAQPTTPAAASVPADEPIIYWASTVKPRLVEWLWPGRIPLGKLTTFAGVGGLGKTFVLCDMTARITKGMEWPNASGECAKVGKVLFISGEDDPDDTLVPRMIEMGADLSKVAFLKTEVQDRFTMADLTTLEKALDHMGDGVRFVAIDPPTAYLGGVNDHNNAELRSLLSPLKSWAARRHIAIVFNTHVNKGSGQKVDAMMRVMGSVAWVNAVRAAHMFARDPEDGTRRLFCGMKNNLGPELKGLAYRLETVGDLAKVQWLGEVETTADEAVNKASPRERRDVVAADWLVEKFKEKLEWESRALFDAAKAENISRNAIFEAKNKLMLPKAKKRTLENGDEIWVWWVPSDWPKLKDEEPGEGIPL